MGELTAPRETVVITDLVAELAGVLDQTAISVRGRCCWLAPTLDADGADWRAVERTGDPTLYDGTAGIAAALVAVANSAASPGDRDALVALAVAAIRHALDRAPSLPGPGLLDGRSGIALAALSVGAVADEAAITAEGSRLLAAVADERGTAVGGDDLVSGLAGTVVAFGRADDIVGSGCWRERAVTAADRLVARGRRWPWGMSWPSEPLSTGSPATDEPDLCGLAHGTSGGLLAMAVASALTGAQRYAEAIALARRYERSWFDPATNGWPDLRGWDGESVPPRPARWCHGATGIGLSRLALAASTNPADPALLGETAVALQATVADARRELDAAASAPGSALPAGVTVCHGLGGALELLVEASSGLDDPIHREVAAQLALRAVGLLGPDVARWPGGVRGNPGPGLMNGAAGAMWVLARVADPTLAAGPGLLRLQAA